MYAPATPAPPAVSLAPVGIASIRPVLGSIPGKLQPSKLQVRHADLNVLEGHGAVVLGTLRPNFAGQEVALQALGDHGWRTLAATRTGAKGRFRLRYLPRQTGSALVRLRFLGNVGELPTRHRLGRLNVYRLAGASWYGGSGGLACGGSLTSSTLGVANKTLPCGSLVTLRYAGRSVRVPVVDRGPYVAGRDFDLTQATKQALGFGDTGEVWSTR
jgi:rare lipoprotein A